MIILEGVLVFGFFGTREWQWYSSTQEKNHSQNSTFTNTTNVESRVEAIKHRAFIIPNRIDLFPRNWLSKIIQA